MRRGFNRWAPISNPSVQTFDRAESQHKGWTIFLTVDQKITPFYEYDASA